MSDLDNAYSELADLVFADVPNPLTQLPTETANLLSARWHTIRKDSPAKDWFNLDVTHPAVARQLRIDPSQDGAAYALAPFRLGKVGEAHRILAAWPCPRMLGPCDDDWLSIEAVIAWNPIDDTAEVLGDPDQRTVGRFHDAAQGDVFASPRAFFQSWAMARAGFYVRWRADSLKAWSSAPEEADLAPGVLLLASPERVRWNPATLPASITVHGIDPARVNKAIFKAARLPRVNASMRAAA